MLDIGRLKMYLIDIRKVGILDDMTGPVGLNVINGNKITLCARSRPLPQQYGDENDHDYAIRVANEMLVDEPDMKYFAFYEINTWEDSAPRLRYGTLGKQDATIETV